LPSRRTPTKEQSLAQFLTPSKANGAKSAALATRIDASHTDSVLKPWIKPVIRFICLESGQPKRGPTLIAAMEHIIAPGGRKTADEWVGRHLTSLLAAIFHTVQARFNALVAVPIEGEETQTLDNKEIMALLNRARREIKVRDLEEEEAWAGWTGLSVRDFDAALAKVSKQEWLDSDWYKGIDDVVRTGDAEILDGEDADLEVPILVRRVDTMFQERYDYLSEARREHYKNWKGGMLARISQLREAEYQNAMEVDAS
jgi:origin recognition complex subunit 6